VFENRVLREKNCMGLAGHVARMGEGEVLIRLWQGIVRGRIHLEVPGINGRIILKWVFSK
jgi:hypothetical protein